MANKNQVAAYSPKIRQKWYFLAEKAGKTVDEVCGLYMISRKTYYKWKRKDLESRTYVPRKEHPETKIKGEIRVCIAEEKLRLNYSLKLSGTNGLRLISILTLERAFDNFSPSVANSFALGFSLRMILSALCIYS